MPMAQKTYDIIIVGAGPRRTNRWNLRRKNWTKNADSCVSYCPICDGSFFKDLTVTVIGSGDEAANDALFMTKIARKVTP